MNMNDLRKCSSFFDLEFDDILSFSKGRLKLLVINFGKIQSLHYSPSRNTYINIYN